MGKQKCIQVRSVTYAQKGQEILKRYGIRASLSRKAGGKYGCAWCITVPASQSETAKSLLIGGGVAMTGEIYDIP